MQRRQCFGFAVKYSRPHDRRTGYAGWFVNRDTGNISVCFPASSGVERQHDTFVDGFGNRKMLPTRFAGAEPAVIGRIPRLPLYGTPPLVRG